MGLPTVKRFCFCCDLETGGLIIGWFTAVMSFFLMLGSIGLVFLASTALLVGPTAQDRLESFAWIIVGSLYILYFLIYLVAGIGLVMAVKQQDPFRMKLMMILMVIGIVLAFFSLLLGNLAASLASAIIYTCIYVYFFICIYSLYTKLIAEKMGNNTNVNLQPIQPF